jgi:membrane-bound serine protease (ClpP class)
MKPRVVFLLYVLDEIIVGIVIFLLMYYFTNWNIWTVVTVVIIFALFFLFMLYVFLPQFKKPQTGKEELIGLMCTALTTLDPHGQIKVQGEIWSARSFAGRIEKGCKVKIVDMDGLELLVKKIE